MPIKTPDFWYRKLNNTSAPLFENLLSPLSSVYRLIHNLNMSSKSENVAYLPIICVGNITAGGSGKTPTCVALRTLIGKYDLFENPFFLTRGYGGKNKIARVISVHDDPSEVGDEALILVKHSKTIVSPVRHVGALMAHDLDADCVIMDDGFQNPSLKKNISFLVIDGEMGLGNEKLLPAGPLREPFLEALKRTDAIIFIGEDTRDLIERVPNEIPIFRAKITSTYDKEKKSSYIGFAGLARPKKFLNTLISEGFDVIDFIEFPDHHPYTEADIEKLCGKAKKLNATLITTEKDLIKIPPKFHKIIECLPIKLDWHNDKDVVSFLQKAGSFNKTNAHITS